MVRNNAHAMQGTEFARDIETRAKAVGLSIDALCKRAEIARSTFQRMKSGEVDPQVGTVNRLLEIIAAEERESAGGSGAPPLANGSTG